MGKTKGFKVDMGVRHGCILSPRVFNVYIDAVIKSENGVRKTGIKFMA